MKQPTAKCNPARVVALSQRGSSLNEEVSATPPRLPGHARRVFTVFGGCFAAFIAAIVLINFGLKSATVWLQVAGVLLFSVAAVVSVRSHKIVRSAKCPKCGDEMAQGHDGHETDGIFSCSRCGSKWSTAMRWS